MGADGAGGPYGPSEETRVVYLDINPPPKEAPPGESHFLSVYVRLTFKQKMQLIFGDYLTISGQTGKGIKDSKLIVNIK